MKLMTLGSGSKGNCHILESNGQIILLDCGVTIGRIKRCLDHDFSLLAGCIVTHKHHDHAAAVKDLRAYGVDVLTPYELEIKKVMRSMRGEFKVMSFPVREPSTGRWLHSDSDSTECPVVAYIIWTSDNKCVFYLTDVEYMPYFLKKYQFQTMIIGCNYCGDESIDRAKALHVYRGHLGLNTVKEMIRVNQTPKLEHIVLCHLSQTADDERMVREVQEVVGEDVTVDIAVYKKVIEL